MKVKLSFLLILIGSVLLLCGAENPRPSVQVPSRLTDQPNDNTEKDKNITIPKIPLPSKTPQQIQNPISSQDSSSKSRSNSNKFKEPWWIFVFSWFAGITAQGFFGFIVAVATCALAWFSYQLVGVTRDMHKATESAAKAAEKSAEVASAAIHTDRPFLLITNVKAFYNVSDRQLRASIHIHNFGVGPADIIDYIASAELFNQPPQDPSISYGPNDGNAVNDSLIAPGESAPGKFSAQISLTDSEDADVRSDTKRIGIHGRVRYRGAPKQEYESRFFWWYFADPGSTVCIRAMKKKLNDHT